MSGLPTESLPGQLARSRLVHGDHTAEEPEIFWRDRRGAHIEPAPDDLGKRAHRVALIGDGVSHRARSGLFENQTEQTGGVEVMHGWPALATVPDIPGDSAPSSGLDE